jgi:putative hydrolase of the HAD superfamily
VLGTVQEQADTERLDKSFGNAFNSMFQSHPNFGASSNSSMTSKQWWREVVCKTFTDAGMTLGDKDDEVCANLFEEFSGGSCWEVYGDTVPFLETAVQSGHTLAVLSNFDERLESILADLDLLRYFSIVIASRKVLHAKPDPHIFQLLIKKTGMEPKDIIHVGNSLEHDYSPPRELGMRSYLLLRDPKKTLPLRTEGLDVISSLTDLFTQNIII